LKFIPSGLPRWEGVWSFDRHISLICKPDFRLPPEAHAQPLVLQFKIGPPFDSGIKIEGVVGASESVPSRFNLQNSKEGVAALYEDIIKRSSNNTIAPDDAKEFAVKLLLLDSKLRDSV
jgi:hypothetical protein